MSGDFVKTSFQVRLTTCDATAAIDTALTTPCLWVASLGDDSLVDDPTMCSSRPSGSGAVLQDFVYYVRTFFLATWARYQEVSCRLEESLEPAAFVRSAALLRKHAATLQTHFSSDERTRWCTEMPVSADMKHGYSCHQDSLRRSLTCFLSALEMFASTFATRPSNKIHHNVECCLSMLWNQTVHLLSHPALSSAERRRQLEVVAPSTVSGRHVRLPPWDILTSLVYRAICQCSGSSWVWLLWNQHTEQLEVRQTSNAESPAFPSSSYATAENCAVLWGCDVFEHQLFRLAESLDAQHSNAVSSMNDDADVGDVSTLLLGQLDEARLLRLYAAQVCRSFPVWDVYNRWMSLVSRGALQRTYMSHL